MKKKWGFVTCGPNQVLVVSGCCHSKPSISVGGRVFVCPLIHKLQILTLNILTVSLETINTHSHHGIPVTVRGTAQVKIRNTKESLRRACELFLGMIDSEMISLFREIIEGHQRDIIGKMDIQDIYYRQDVFCKKLLDCQSKLEEMGLHLISYNINQVEDTTGCIQDHMKQVAANNLKNLRIEEAECNRDSIIETILSESEVKLVQVSLESEIVKSERELEIRKLENEVESSKLEAVEEMTSLLEQVRNAGKVKMSHLDGDELASELLLEKEETNVQKKRSSLCREFMELDSHEQSLDMMTRAHCKVIKDCAETEAEVVQLLAKTHSQLLQLASSTENNLIGMMMTLPKEQELFDTSQITDTSTLINTNGHLPAFNEEDTFLSDVCNERTRHNELSTHPVQPCPENVMAGIREASCDTTTIMRHNTLPSSNEEKEVVMSDGLVMKEEKEEEEEEEFLNGEKRMEDNQKNEFEMLSEVHLKVSQMIGLNLSNVIFAAVFEEVLELLLK